MSNNEPKVEGLYKGNRFRTLSALGAVFVIGAMGIVTAGWIRSNYANPQRFYVHELPPAEPTPPIAARVVLVVSDGLRDDVARQLPNMSSLASRPDAVFRRSVTQVPSLSIPGSISLLCGVGPTKSGFPLNESAGQVSVECLIDTLAQSGLSSAVAGVGEGFDKRFRLPNTQIFARPRSDDVSAYVPHDHESFQLSKKALAADANFVCLYFPDVDEESHLSGALSQQALDAARIFDGFVGEIAAALDFSRDTLVVTSDHGHRDQGGHGGYEWLARRSPLLMVGKGIKGGSTADVAQSQIAPTMAALLGVPRPRHAEGMPLLGDLDVPAFVAESIRVAHEAALKRKLQADLAAISGKQAPPGEIEVLETQIAEAGWARGVREAIKRVPGAAILLVVLFLVVAFAGGLKRHSLIGGVIAAGVFAFLMWAAGWRLTISQFNVAADESQVTLSLLGAAGAGVLLGAATSKMVAKQVSLSHTPFSEHVVAVTAIFQAIAGAMVASLLVFYGVRYSWRLPDLRLGLPTFWAMYGSGFAGFAAVVYVALSGLVDVVRQRRVAESIRAEDPGDRPVQADETREVSSKT